jgi:hypothetical protein
MSAFWNPRRVVASAASDGIASGTVAQHESRGTGLNRVRTLPHPVPALKVDVVEQHPDPHPDSLPGLDVRRGVHGCVRLPNVVLQNQRLFGQIRDGDPRLEGGAPGDLDGMPERDMIRVAIA